MEDCLALNKTLVGKEQSVFQHEMELGFKELSSKMHLVKPKEAKEKSGLSATARLLPGGLKGKEKEGDDDSDDESTDTADNEPALLGDPRSAMKLQMARLAKHAQEMRETKAKLKQDALPADGTQPGEKLTPISSPRPRAKICPRQPPQPPNALPSLLSSLLLMPALYPNLQRRSRRLPRCRPP